VSRFLNCVQITKAKMPRLDGRKPADKVFSKIESEAGASSAGDLRRRHAVLNGATGRIFFFVRSVLFVLLCGSA
jgi:hypothetical protein